MTFTPKKAERTSAPVTRHGVDPRTCLWGILLGYACAKFDALAA